MVKVLETLGRLDQAITNAKSNLYSQSLKENS